MNCMTGTSRRRVQFENLKNITSGQAVLDTVHVTVFGQSNVVSAEGMADTFFVAS